MKNFLDVEKDLSRRSSVFSASEDGSEFARRTKLKYGGPLTAALTLFVDFSSKSTIHGVRYLGERHRHWTERTFWIIAFLTSALGCSLMVMQIYDKWTNSPVIVSFAEKATPVWEIPFPSVTICSDRKVLPEFLNFTEAFERLIALEAYNLTLTESELRIMEALSQICYSELYSFRIINSSLQGSEIMPLLRKISPSLKQISLACVWQNHFDACSAFLTGKIIWLNYGKNFL